MLNDSETYLKNFNLSNNDQSISINEFKKLNSDILLDLNIKDLNLEKSLSIFYDQASILEGNLNLSSKINLVDNNLESEIDLTINDVSLNINNNFKPININNLSFNLNYTDEELNIQTLTKINQQSFSFNSKLPINLDLQEKKILFKNEDSLYFFVGIDSLDLDFVNYFMSSRNNFSGILNANIIAEGSKLKPLISGFINLDSGNYINHDLGIKFNDFKSNIEINNNKSVNKVSLENFSFNSGRGNFQMTGFAEFDLNDFTGKDNIVVIKDTKLNAKFNDLQTTNNNLLRSHISGTLELKNYNIFNNESNNSIVFPNFIIEGFLRSNEVRLNLDELLKINNVKTIPEPILVTIKNSVIDSANNFDVKKSFIIPDINIKINVDLPRNVWIYGKDVNLELNGNAIIQMIDTNNFFDGFIEITRGYYQFLGKRFVFQEGGLKLTGEKLENPEISIIANYFFRNIYGIRQKITLSIKGNIETPILTFYLDDQIIDEKDAISLIVFGRGSDLLTRNEEQAVSQNINELQTVTALVAGQLSSQLTQILQKQFNFDLLEIKGENQWQEASFTIGRYFGNNLFISYEKVFDFTDFKALKTDRLNVEYQINKYLFLNTTQGAGNENGIDLKVKWQK